MKMKINQQTIIKGNLVILVPYEENHVPKYHEWMKSKELQQLTGSEPLTLEEEFNMQKLWREDPGKCTFIVLHKAKYNISNNEVDAMVGDINLYLRHVDDEIIGEIGIMVAEISARRKGLGREALMLMMRYGLENLHIDIFEAKIGIDNHISISLFSKIGFEKTKGENIFNEMTFQKKVTTSWTHWLMSQTQNYLAVER